MPAVGTPHLQQHMQQPLLLLLLLPGLHHPTLLHAQLLLLLLLLRPCPLPLPIGQQARKAQS
jgi:hypothetical protein